MDKMALNHQWNFNPPEPLPMNKPMRDPIGSFGGSGGMPRQITKNPLNMLGGMNTDSRGGYSNGSTQGFGGGFGENRGGGVIGSDRSGMGVGKIGDGTPKGMGGPQNNGTGYTTDGYGMGAMGNRGGGNAGRGSPGNGYGGGFNNGNNGMFSGMGERGDRNGMGGSNRGGMDMGNNGIEMEWEEATVEGWIWETMGWGVETVGGWKWETAG